MFLICSYVRLWLSRVLGKRRHMGAGMKGEADVGFFNVLTGLLTLMLAGVLALVLTGIPAGLRALAPARPLHVLHLPVRVAPGAQRRARSLRRRLDACRPACGAVTDANPPQG